jgi:prolyl-tRNA synthetase
VIAVRAEGDVVDQATKLAEELRAEGVRVELDDRTDVSLGRRVTDWELKGVPVRLELGPRDLVDGSVTLVRRISGAKGAVPLAGAAKAVTDAVDEQQAELLAEATARRDEHLVDVDSIEEAAEAAASGWARLAWDRVGAAGEARLAEQSVTVRCLLNEDGTVPASEQEPGLTAVVARSY